MKYAYTKEFLQKKRYRQDLISQKKTQHKNFK